jgi:teichuronic acid exporter
MSIPPSPDTTPQDTINVEVRDAAISGAKAMGVRTILSIVLSAASRLAIGRLLSPTETSIFNTGSQITGPVQFLGEGCLGSALVRQETEPTDDEMFSVFVMQLGITVIAVTALLIAVPWLLHLYNLGPGAAPILVVLSLSLLVSSQRILPLLYFERRLRFDVIARVETTENVVQVATLICFALAHLGAWALTLSASARLLVGASLYWFYMPWRPRGRFCWEIVRRLATFGIPQQLCAIAPVVGGLWLALSVNRFAGEDGMGFVSMASVLASIPIMLSAVLNRVAFSAYSRLSSDSAEQGRVLMKTLRLFGIALGVVVPFFAAITSALISPILGAKWEPCIVLFRWYCFFSITNTLTGLIAQNQAASGRPMERFWIAVAAGIFTWGLGFYLVYQFQLGGVGPAIFIGSLLELYISMVIIRKNSNGCQNIFSEIGFPLILILGLGGIALLVSQHFFSGKSFIECIISIGLFLVLLVFIDITTQGKILRAEIFQIINRFNK